MQPHTNQEYFTHLGSSFWRGEMTILRNLLRSTCALLTCLVKLVIWPIAFALHRRVHSQNLSCWTCALVSWISKPTLSHIDETHSQVSEPGLTVLKIAAPIIRALGEFWRCLDNTITHLETLERYPNLARVLLLQEGSDVSAPNQSSVFNREDTNLSTFEHHDGSSAKPCGRSQLVIASPDQQDVTEEAENKSVVKTACLTYQDRSRARYSIRMSQSWPARLGYEYGKQDNVERGQENSLPLKSTKVNIPGTSGCTGQDLQDPAESLASQASNNCSANADHRVKCVACMESANEQNRMSHGTDSDPQPAVSKLGRGKSSIPVKKDATSWRRP